MINARHALALLLAAAAAGAPGCTYGAFDTDRYQAAVHAHVSRALPSLRIEDAVGKVNVQAWNESYVQIDAIKRASSQDAVDNIRVVVTPEGSTLDVRADFGTQNVNHRAVDFTIHTPASTNVSVTSSVGDIQIAGFTGNVSAQASTGSMTVTMAKLRGAQRITLEASVGSIDLKLPANASATIDAQTSVGNVGGNAPLEVDHNTVGATGHGVLGAGSAHVSITASTGSVNIDRE